MRTPIEIRNESLLRLPDASEHMTNLDAGIFKMLRQGANPDDLKDWLIDAVDLFDSATLPDEATTSKETTATDEFTA